MTSDMMKEHRGQLMDLENLIETERSSAVNTRDANEKEMRDMFETQAQVKIGDINRRTTMAGDNIVRIREEVAAKTRKAEISWQVESSKWTTVASKKVEVKKREDADANKNKRKKRGES